MKTKLGAFCDSVMETGWLLALLVVPLYFNVYSSRVFEPDKLSILRSIALVMIGAWVIKFAEQGLGLVGEKAPESEGNGKMAPRESSQRLSLFERVIRVPLILPTFLTIIIYLLSTVFSVAPRISLWGSYMRLQGTYTTLSYIVIFFIVLQNLRTRAQLDRLLNAVVITSLPISLYGILQHFRLDSLPWSGDTVLRVASNMGNAIFVAAYLIMAIPITLARLIDHFNALLDEETGTAADAILTGSYAFIFVVQLICTFFTQSRGPWLGLFGGIYFFVLLLLVWLRRTAPDQSRLSMHELLTALAFAVVSLPVGVIPAYVVLAAFRRGMRWLWLSFCIQSLILASFLVVFNLPNNPFMGLREMPYIGRLGNLFQTEEGTGKVRVLIWEGAVKLIAANPFRAIFGYGPETMHVAYNPYYPPDLAHYEARNASPDRSHNETFDALVITGAVGFLIYMWLFTAVFYYGLKWLGFMETRRQRNLFLALGIGGAAAATVLAAIIDREFRFVGVALPAGFISGIAAYLMIVAFFAHGQSREREDRFRQILLIALLATIVGHFIEIHFGIAIAATRTYFWIFAALLVVIGMGWFQKEEPALEPVYRPATTSQELYSRRRKKKRSRREAFVSQPVSTHGVATEPNPMLELITRTLLVSVLLCTLGFEFVANPMGEMDSLRIISLSLTTLAPRGSPHIIAYGVLWMFVLTWLVAGMVAIASILILYRQRQQGVSWLLQAFGVYALITLLVFLIFLFTHTSLIKPNRDIANTVVFYYLFLGLSLLFLSIVLTVQKSLPVQFWQKSNLWLYPILAAGIALAIFTTNVSIVKADIYYKQGLKLEEEQRWDASIALYSKAIAWAPDQDYYYLFLGRALMEKAIAVTTPEERATWLEQSRAALEKAKDLNPLNTDHFANLGRLYRTWADYAATPEERQEKLQTALGYYEKAASLSPHNAQIINEWGLTYLVLGDMPNALEKFEYSLSLDQKFDMTYVLLGNYYSITGDREKAIENYEKAVEINPEQVQAYASLGLLYYEQGAITKAIEANQKAIALAPNLIQAHSTLGKIYYDQGMLTEAIQANLNVLDFAPDDLVSHRNLAILYQQTGQYELALEEARIALSLSPESEKPTMQAFIQQLEQMIGQIVTPTTQ
ncbi:MAG: tetratricopeptide repeat protein [Chloroflexi bacterium]|nr:tetratricopeptide repeat protein [Chloroflexota bacterium]